MFIGKFLILSNEKLKSFKDDLYIRLPETSEKYFIEYGMDEFIVSGRKISSIKSIEKDSSNLGTGKVFEHILDLGTHKVNTVTLSGNNKFLFSFDSKYFSVKNDVITFLPLEEKYFSNGMSSNSSIDIANGILTKRQYVENISNSLGTGKLFKRKVNLNSDMLPIKHAQIVSSALNKSLVFHEGNYKYYTSSWNIISESSLTDETFITYGMNDISLITEQAWSDLTGEIELLCWTNEQSNTDVTFVISTQNFYLIEELEGKTLKIYEFTHNLYQNDSIVTMQTEAFSIYDELGEDADVLYYTNIPTVTKATLEMDVIYSPLDEIKDDFDIVSRSQDIEFNNTLDIVALPTNQFIVGETIDFYGDIQSIIAQTNVYTGKVRFLFSFDGGVTWKSLQAREWININVGDKQSILKYGMSDKQVNRTRKSDWDKVLSNNTKVGYYIEDKLISDDTEVLPLKYSTLATSTDVKFSDLAFYMLNTTATINLLFAGNKLQGIIDDEDKGKVKYRVFLNDNPYYPASGQFTSLRPSPLSVNIVVDDKLINFGVNNTIRVEFQDYWGIVDSWSTTFIGSHSGLLFTDELGNFYTTAFGEVLKNLDFGQIIAGQTTIDYKVLLKNNIGYTVENVKISSIQPSVDGVTVELSEKQSPFIPVSEIFYPEVLETGDQVEFAVRLSTELTAEETSAGRFEIRVNADRVY